MTRKRSLLGLLLAVLTAVVLWWTQGDPGTQPAPTPDDSSAETTASSPSSAPSSAPETDPESGLPIVAVADLPPEAHDTLDLIEAGGPYPYERDGATFENREGLLPDHPEGYYAEYTVETPGSDDRGARRIVTGDGGEYYWTQDHYASFERIAR
jgi:ribonuclease T1